MFSWDAGKALGNRKKHGVSFEEAATVLATPTPWIETIPSIPTWRFARSVSGFSAAGRILIVVYTPRRMKNGKEIIRIISARQATRKERKAYDG